MLTLNNFNNNTALFSALEHLVIDDNPVKLMVLLADLEAIARKQGIFNQNEFSQLGNLQALLAELVLIREKALSANFG